MKNQKKLDVKLNRFHEMDFIDYIEAKNGPKLDIRVFVAAEHSKNFSQGHARNRVLWTKK